MNSPKEMEKSIKGLIEAGTGKRPLMNEEECASYWTKHNNCKECISAFSCHQMLAILEVFTLCPSDTPRDSGDHLKVEKSIEKIIAAKTDDDLKNNQEEIF